MQSSGSNLEEKCHHTVTHQHGSGASLIARVVSRERLVAGAVALNSMSAEERLLALEQLVAAMQGEVISALTAAAQAEQRATDAATRVLGVRGEGVVDTRLL